MIRRRKHGDKTKFAYVSSLTSADKVAGTKYRCGSCNCQIVGEGNAATLLTHAYLAHDKEVLESNPQTWEDLRDLLYVPVVKVNEISEQPAADAQSENDLGINVWSPEQQRNVGQDLQDILFDENWQPSNEDPFFCPDDEL
tara:strand:- start:68 stop:490 length:423 start_codon:yes stop_codon:yes gene_type:complete